MLSILLIILKEKHRYTNHEVLEVLLILIIYSNYSRNMTEKDELFDVLKEKYKESVSQVNLVHNLSGSLIDVVNRKHDACSLKQTRRLINQFWDRYTSERKLDG